MSAATVRNIAIVLGVALALTALPRGRQSLDVIGAALWIAFLAVIAAGGWRLYRSQSFWLSTLGDRNRAVLYAALGAGAFTIAARERFLELGVGLLWYAALAACGGAVYWVWQDSRRYTV